MSGCACIPEAEDYTLEFDEDGNGFMAHALGEGDPRWCRQMLQVQAMKDIEDGEPFLLDGEGGVRLWSEFVAKFTETVVGYKIRGSGHGCSVRAWVFAKSSGGSKVFW